MTRSTLKILYHNVLAWTYQRKIELGNYYGRMNPDIILMNSTNNINDERVKIYNYNIHERNFLNERHAGIAIAIKKDIKYKILDDFRDDILAIQTETSKGPIIIATLYSPPRRQYLPVGELKRLTQKNMPVYIIGDLNANHQMMGYGRPNLKGNIIIDLISRGHLIYKGPDFETLVGRKGKPDIVLVNRYDYLNMIITEGDITTSDHLPFLVTLSTKPIIKEIKQTRNYKNADWDSYQSKLEEKIERQYRQIPLNRGPIDRNKIDIAIQTWMQDIIDTANETIPMKTIKYHIHTKDSDLIKILETSYDTIKNKAVWNEEDRQLTRRIQEMIREESTRLARETWAETINKLQDCYGDPRKFWAKVGRLMGSKTAQEPYLLDNRGRKIYDDIEKEEKFREIWSQTFTITEEENRMYDVTNDRQVTDFMNTNEFLTEPFNYADTDRLDPDNFLTKPTTRQEIKQILGEFKNYKAPGQSGINKLLMIKLPDVALDRYVDILNLLLSMGYFPVVFKNGIIILIPKPGKDPKIPSNYRPITLLEVPGKVLEKIINKRLQRYCEENDIFNKNQYGFRSGRGTDVALSKLYETIALNQLYKDHCNIICRDISKAFDKVWHQGLKYKIVRTELPSIIVKILSSYLKDRTAQIKYKEVLGPRFEIRSGVPQGGILSPTLFIHK